MINDHIQLLGVICINYQFLVLLGKVLENEQKYIHIAW